MIRALIEALSRIGFVAGSTAFLYVFGRTILGRD